MERTEKTYNKSRINSIGTPIIMVILTFLTFVFTYTCLIKVDYNNLGGAHCWLTGSTIKFVNNWYYDGIVKDHFTFYECFDSVEHSTLEKREPYLSYPTGVGVLVYLAGKIIGRDHITVSGIKRIAISLFAIETIIISTFGYFFMSSGWFGWKKHFRKRAAGGYFMGLIYMLLPVNAWYLINTFFADQAVLLFVILFLCLEYAWLKKSHWLIRIFEMFIIFAGVLTDYYFWLVVFFYFVFCIVRSILQKRTVVISVKEALYYVVPVVLAVATYIWQLQFTGGFFDILTEKFLLRAGGLEEDQEYSNIYLIVQNMRNSLFNGSYQNMFLFLGLQIVMIILVFFVLSKRDWKNLFLNDELYVLSGLWVSTVAQLILLRNHSAIHEFSMMKVGLIVEITLLLITMSFNTAVNNIQLTNGRSIEKTSMGLFIAFVVLMLLIGFPYSTYRFVNNRYKEEEYEIEYVLSEKAEYSQVFFSFTYPIPINPPQKLSISEKEIYKINSIDDVNTLFPDLSKDAEKILVVDKLDKEKEDDIIMKEETIISRGSIIYEDDTVMLVAFS